MKNKIWLYVTGILVLIVMLFFAENLIKKSSVYTHETIEKVASTSKSNQISIEDTLKLAKSNDLANPGTINNLNQIDEIQSELINLLNLLNIDNKTAFVTNYEIQIIDISVFWICEFTDELGYGSFVLDDQSKKIVQLSLFSEDSHMSNNAEDKIETYLSYLEIKDYKWAKDAPDYRVTLENGQIINFWIDNEKMLLNLVDI